MAARRRRLPRGALDGDLAVPVMVAAARVDAGAGAGALDRVLERLELPRGEDEVARGGVCGEGGVVPRGREEWQAMVGGLGGVGGAGRVAIDARACADGKPEGRGEGVPKQANEVAQRAEDRDARRDWVYCCG
jgi:hypothetical protein